MQELRLSGPGCRPLFCLGLDPRRWRELFDFRDFSRRQTRKQIFQVIERVDSLPPATAQQGVDHGAAFSGSRMSNEQPVLFSKGTGPNGVLDGIAVDFQHAVVHESRERFPMFQRVVKVSTC